VFTQKDLFYQETDIFTYKNDNFNIAVALTDYDMNREPIYDPTMGELIFTQYKWGFNSTDGKPYSGRYPIPSH